MLCEEALQWKSSLRTAAKTRHPWGLTVTSLDPVHFFLQFGATRYQGVRGIGCVSVVMKLFERLMAGLLLRSVVHLCISLRQDHAQTSWTCGQANVGMCGQGARETQSLLMTRATMGAERMWS